MTDRTFDDSAPLNAVLSVDRARGTRGYNRNIFGHFLEHFHTQVYGGIYWPGHRLSDAQGFRRDVIEAMRELGAPVMRWPGGNFVSDYHWRDAVGPDRQPSYNMAWQVPEPNSFGTAEFVAWCREVGCAPYICTNGGNGTAQEMSDWVEYCNGALATRNTALRRAHGHGEPFAVRYWGIGNESYGDWQIGAKTIAEWGPYVAESAKMMRRVDPAIVLSAAAVPDLDWTLALLRAAGRYLDLVSIHDYWDPLWQQDSPKSYLAAMLECERPDAAIAQTRAVITAAGFKDRIGIAFDEWNLRGWHHPAGNSPQALEARNRNDLAETYTMADAVFSAGFLNACLRNADLVQMANISPSVNTRGPLFVHDGGVVRRTSFHALKLYVDHLLPRLTDCHVVCDRLTHEGRSVAAVDAVVSAEADRLALLVTNRHPDLPVAMTLRVDGQNPSGEFALTSLDGDSPDAFNSVDQPDRVVPRATRVRIVDGRLELPPHSIVALELA